MSEKQSSTLKNILVNIIVATVTGSVVFAVTMTSVVKQVTLNTRDIQYAKEVDLALRADLDTERKRNDERIFQVVQLVERQIDQNKEFISALRARNNFPPPKP